MPHPAAEGGARMEKAMAKFYYQIKGRRPAKNAYGEDEWAWPPVFSGMVEGPDRKAAKAVVEEQY